MVYSDRICDMNEKTEISLPKAMIEVIIRLGRAQQLLRHLLDDEIWDNLSKHNPKWESEHEREDEILHDVRIKLAFVNDHLHDICYLLQPENE
jgi:hypothetical protein